MRSTFKVLFFLKRDKKKANGTIPLFCRITVDGKEVRFSMKCDVNPNHWDIKTGKASGRTTEPLPIYKHFEFSYHFFCKKFKIYLSLRSQIKDGRVAQLDRATAF